jgi:hypothetical protein
MLKNMLPECVLNTLNKCCIDLKVIKNIKLTQEYVA